MSGFDYIYYPPDPPEWTGYHVYITDTTYRTVIHKGRIWHHVVTYYNNNWSWGRYEAIVDTCDPREIRIPF